MPRRELSDPQQVERWLEEMSATLTQPGQLILIGSGALLWHAAQLGISEGLPENSMDVDPVTDSDEIAERCYDGMIGSEFEQRHGWHINLMPAAVLREFAADWETRAAHRSYGYLNVVVPSPADLLVPKRKRDEPRDRAHIAWAERTGMLDLKP
jgi:hypothetical protein